MNRGKPAYLRGILGLIITLLCASCGEEGKSQDYQCIDETGTVVDIPVFVGKGKDLYFGSLEDQTNRSCARVWHYVSVGGGRDYQCKTAEGNWNMKDSKTQPLPDPWADGSCADVGRPTTPTITDISSSGLVKWTASQSNVAGNQNSPPEGYIIVTSTMPISEALFKDKVESNDYEFVDGTSTSTESFQLGLGQGNYYIRIRAENDNGAQLSALSSEKSFSIESRGISIYPNPISKGGITRARLTLGSNYTGDFSDLTLKVGGTNVPVDQDIDKKNVFYFTPPLPTSTNSIALHITSSGTGNIDISNGISVTSNNPEQTNAVLQGNMVDVEKAYSDVKSSGLTGINAQLRFIDQAYEYAQPAVDMLDKLWLDAVFKDQTQISYTFTSHIKESQDLVEKLFKTFGSIPVPAAKVAADEPQFGRFGWFTDVKKLLDAGAPYYFKRYGDAMFVALKADSYTLQTYVNQSAGKTVTDAVAANPDARIVTNGSVFGYVNLDGTHREPLISAGIVINNGIVQPTSCAVITTPPTEGCEKLAKWRWWFGQQYDGAFVHGGRVKSGKTLQSDGHPPLPHSPTVPSDLKAGLGGMYIYITDRTTSTENPNPGRHIVVPSEDNDLGVFQSIKGKFGGWGGVGYDKETKIIVVFSKTSGLYQNLSDAVQALYDMGTDWCVGNDGGGSSALALKNSGTNAFDYMVRSLQRHDDANRPIEANTVTNYLVYLPK
jgi:hypothetical protein